jgi:hypothetical protein
MKYTLLFLSLLLLSSQQLLAQLSLDQALNEVYNAQACGCATDLEGLSDKETAKAFSDKFNLEELKKSFKGNDKAQLMLQTLSEVNKPDKLNKELSNILNSLKEKPKQGDFIDQISSSFEKIEQFQGDANIKAKFAACQLAQALHRYYLQYPNEAPKTGQDYQAYANKLISNKKPNTNPKNEPEDKNLAANPATTAELGLSNIVFHPITLASILLNLLLIFLMLRKKEDKAVAIEQDDKHSKDSNKLLEQQNAKLKTEIQNLEFRINELNTQNKQHAVTIEQLKRDIQQKNQIQQINVVPQQQPIQQVSTSKQLFLDSPNTNGIFLSNSVKEAKSLDSVYKMILNANEQEGDLFLIEEEVVLNRAFNLYEVFIQPACDVDGRGAVNLSTLKQTPGKVRREGGGWRIEKKIILKW